MNVSITEEEKRIFAKNEEKLWDLTARTLLPTIVGTVPTATHSECAVIAYDYADALMLERRKRLRSTGPEISGVG